MNVGLTYDLRDDYAGEGLSDEQVAELDRADTLNAIEGTLRELGYRTDRIGNLKALMKRLLKGDCWDIVFNIAEGLYGLGRESQVPALLDAYRIPYTFSDPMVLSLALHKGMTKHIIKNLGIPTPDFFLVQSESDLHKVSLPFPVFAKPVAEGTGKGISPKSKISNKESLVSVCRSLLTAYGQPVLVEAFLPGREFTVGIIGTGDGAYSVGVLEIVLRPGAEPGVYSYANKERCEELVDYQSVQGGIAEKAESVALAAWRGLQCRDAGRVDVRADAGGQLHFLEANPLAGLHPEHSDLPMICAKKGISYKELIRRIMEEAKKRTLP
jgi:D-alanine-D-alanine ligase